MGAPRDIDEQDETPCGSWFLSHDTCEPEPEIPMLHVSYMTFVYAIKTYQILS